MHLRDLAVSRHHCVLEADDGGFRLRDLDSRHGTFVNGMPVRERELADGDRITLGESQLLLLFLDEVGELPPTLQAKLLRVLQEREYERVGGTRPLRADVRVVAATNRDLEKAMREGSFREDLYYRLNVITFTLPPLRERPEDIPLLASHFAAHVSRRLGRRTAGFTPEARACLLRYTWPGNVRELANAVERALVLGEGELIRPQVSPN